MARGKDAHCTKDSLELAAGWIRVLSADEIAREIEASLDFLEATTRDLPERHRSVRAVFDHSWALLPEQEQTVLRKLSVFQGGFGLKAAYEVGRATIPLLASLVDKSLIRVDLAGRYDFHPLLHQFIGQKLAESAEEQAATRGRHAAYFLSLAEEAEPQLHGPAMNNWLGRLEEERSNLRAVLDWAERNGQALWGLRVAKVLGDFCETRGYFNEGRELLIKALAQPGAGEPTLLRASALPVAGRMAFMQGDYALARSLHEESLAISRELGDKGGVALALSCLGNVCMELLDLPSARSLFEESLELYRALQDRYGIVTALRNLGYAIFSEGNFALARSLYEECLALSRDIGNEFLIYIALHNLGETIAHQGELLLARSLLEESLRMSRKMEAKWYMVHTLNRLGQVAMKQGDLLPARAFLEESMAISQQIWDKWGMIYAIESFASLAAVVGDFRRTVRLWSAADALRKLLGSPLLPGDLPRYRQDLADARSQLGETVFQDDWAAGRLLSREQAIAYALALGGQEGSVYYAE